MDAVHRPVDCFLSKVSSPTMHINNSCVSLMNTAGFSASIDFPSDPTIRCWLDALVSGPGGLAKYPPSGPLGAVRFSISTHS